MGSNHFGEIEPLSRTLEPDIALINSIAPCHLEAFGDVHGVAKEKCKIFSAFKTGRNRGYSKRLSGNRLLIEQTEKFKTMCFGIDVEVIYHGGNLHGSTIELIFRNPDKRIKLDWPLSGAHQASNAAASATVALALGIAPETIAEGLRSCVLPGMRMKVSRNKRH